MATLKSHFAILAALVLCLVLVVRWRALFLNPHSTPLTSLSETVHLSARPTQLTSESKTVYLSARPTPLTSGSKNGYPSAERLDLKITYAPDNDTTWQLIQDSKVTKSMFLYRAYLDTRGEAYSVVRAFIVTRGHLYRRLFCYLWFDDLNSSYAVDADTKKIEQSPYKANGVHHAQYMVTCPLREQTQDSPHHVSVAVNKDGPYTTYLPVIKSKPPISTSNQFGEYTIGVCLSAQYGDVGDVDAPLLIQWMESLFLFGVSEITWFNSSVRDSGPNMFYTKALNYYESLGWMVTRQLPVPYGALTPPTHDNEYETVETIRLIATNDCLYSNINRFSYILHLDMDEVVVPSSDNTYQQFLKHFINSTAREDLESIVIPSAFYYKFFPPAREDIPTYLPFHRLLYRTAIENPPGRITFKSFDNTQKCISMWNHRCMNGNSKFKMADKADIHVHHYRGSCNTATCARERDTRTLDTTLPDKYGAELEKRTMDVLRKIHYPV